MKSWGDVLWVGDFGRVLERWARACEATIRSCCGGQLLHLFVYATRYPTPSAKFVRTSQHLSLTVLACTRQRTSLITLRFGGKASRSMPVAAAAALAASLLQRPVCFSLTRQEDFASNAGRCAGRVEYAAGFGPDGKVVAIQAKVNGVISCWSCGCMMLL